MSKRASDKQVRELRAMAKSLGMAEVLRELAKLAAEGEGVREHGKSDARDVIAGAAKQIASEGRNVLVLMKRVLGDAGYDATIAPGGLRLDILSRAPGHKWLALVEISDEGVVLRRPEQRAIWALIENMARKAAS